MNSTLKLSRSALLLAGVLCVSPLSASADTSFDKALDQFVEHLDECTQKHGYENEKTSHLDDHELAPNEREWRACAYAGVKSLLVANAEDPAPYERIVKEDREMTDAVVAGKLTRAERQARLDELIEAADEALYRKHRQLQRARLRTIEHVTRAMRRIR
jgi:hypothetical protein